MLLRLNHVGKDYLRGGVPFSAVDQVNLDINQGDFVSIVGRSGSGKTTLLNMITGLLKPDRGDIQFMNSNIGSLSDDDMSALRNSSMGYIPQGASLLANFSILDNVRLPYYLSKTPHDDISGRATYLLDQVGLAHLKDMYPSQLSGGEVRRVAIARALINAPQILVADEPTSDLDVGTIKTIMELLAKVHEQGATMLVVTHELDTIHYSQKICLMQSGKLTEVNKDDAEKETLITLLST